MDISIIAIILLLGIVGFLMIYNSIGMEDPNAVLVKWVIMILGIGCLCGGIYLIIKYIFR